MDTKNLVASLTTAFAFALGAGPAAAQSPQEKPKAEMTKVALGDFNNHSKGVVFQRNLERDIQKEPLLMKQGNGQYLIHEAVALGALTGDGVGKLKTYSQEALIKQYGPIDNIRTYEQYKADADLLNKTPGLGRNLSDNAFDMGTRIKDIQHDMKEAGETFQPKAPKQKVALE